ncbi:hypothetical protein [Chitinophaga ginsengisoli]|uniref:Uncharacterized protein n=1 Tax=Chitinophaga ginsengisoli TaxID=363837 RepID=A0A2P8F6K0_9BACT|nr:hypothetical protein [Chitinophaga ginsengisoli]PSL17322.1 hypothetical protein CLV42_1503 [Chitinophaga ginsengisoli]
MRVLSVVLFLTLQLSACKTDSFSVMSRKMEVTCSTKNSSWKGTTFHDVRMQVFKSGRLNSLIRNIDTLHTLQSYDIQSGTYSVMMWTSQGSLSYTYNRGILSYNVPNLFTKKTVELIQNWDTAGIREEESINANEIPEEHITGIEVIRKGNRNQVRCISFKRFFNLQRDLYHYQ